MTTKPLEAIALFDLDATLADFIQAMEAEMLKLAAPNEDPALWNGSRTKMPDFIRARRSLIKKSPGFWENLHEVQAGFDVYNLVSELGFEKHILTKGPATSTNAWTEKVHWCQAHVPDAAVTISQDKGLVYGRILVDDWPDYIMRWLEWRPRGLVIMLDWPHNQTIEDEDGNEVPFEHPNVFRYMRYRGEGTKSDFAKWTEQQKQLKERLIEARDR